MTSKYQFERTELRTLQNMCKDNEEFLNRVAEMIGDLTQERDKWKDEAQWHSGRNNYDD